MRIVEMEIKMPEQIPENSVGLVTPQRFKSDEALTLNCGRTLDSFELIYETYGELNEDASNAILICHALSGDHHAAGFHDAEERKPGWWDGYIGPGKPIDTNKFFVVSSNNLGGCRGSTGPTSTHPETGKPFGPDFPLMTVKDWVKSQARLADYLGIQNWAAVIGGSLGGMQVLQWSIDYPERVKNAVIIASAPKLSAQNIAFNEVARQSIMTDPDFHEGRFLEHNTSPKRGLMLARMLGHLTYLSDDIMGEKFGRQMRSEGVQYGFGVEFQVESYLRYQGNKFATQMNFDANTYLLMTKALDYFDPASEFNNDLNLTMKQAQANFLVISFTSDWRFSPQRSREIVRALVSNNLNVSYTEVESSQGHDAFLLPNTHYETVLGEYLQRINTEVKA